MSEVQCIKQDELMYDYFGEIKTTQFWVFGVFE